VNISARLYKILLFVFRWTERKQENLLLRYYGIAQGVKPPVPWREREGLPSHSNWPLVKEHPSRFALVLGAVKCGRVRPVRAGSYLTVGGGLPGEDSAAKSRFDPTQYPTLGQASAAVDKAAGRPVTTGPNAADRGKQ